MSLAWKKTIVSAAVSCWLIGFLIITTGSIAVGVIAAAVISLVAGFLLPLKQLVVLSVLNVVAAFQAARRYSALMAHPLTTSHPRQWQATIASRPRLSRTGKTLVTLEPEGMPCTITGTVKEELTIPPPGSHVWVTAHVSRRDSKQMCPYFARVTDWEVTSDPSPVQQATHKLVRGLLEAFNAVLPERLAGLGVGMVVGDTSQVAASDSAIYAASGLSHLTAVSGANVAIITTSVLVLAKMVKIPTFPAVLLATAALVFFIFLVGTEPSVLRAAATGVIGLIAVVTGKRKLPFLSLCMATIFLPLVDTQLLTSYGFALSVAATSGILLVYPQFKKALSVVAMPDFLAAAIALATSAHIVTAPLIGLMVGEFSTVAVLANVLAAPAVAPITVIGVIVLLVHMVAPPLAELLVAVIYPLLWWIDKVAVTTTTLPIATISFGHDLLGVGTIIAVCLWIVVIAYSGWGARLTLAGLGVLAVWALILLLTGQATVDDTQQNVSAVTTVGTVGAQQNRVLPAVMEACGSLQPGQRDDMAA